MYIGFQPIAKHQLGLFVRLQPPEHQPCLVKAPTLDLGAPTLRIPFLPVLRHQLQGLQPFAVNCRDIFGSNSLLPALLDLRLTFVLLLLPRLPDFRLPLFLRVHTCKLSLFSVINARYALTFGFFFACLIFGFPLFGFLCLFEFTNTQKARSFGREAELQKCCIYQRGPF